MAASFKTDKKMIGITADLSIGADMAAAYLTHCFPQYRKMAFASMVNEMLEHGFVPGPVVITDVRSQNEADFVRKRGVLVFLTGPEGQRNLSLGMAQEDVVIEIGGDLTKLYEALQDVVIS